MTQRIIHLKQCCSEHVLGLMSLPVNDKPILYYFYTSYYSQKVLMLLKESGINYDSRVVNVPGQETQSSWFLEIKPKGEVPSLKVSEKIVNGSDNIMNYIEYIICYLLLSPSITLFFSFHLLCRLAMIFGNSPFSEENSRLFIFSQRGTD